MAAFVTTPRVDAVEYYHIVLMLIFLWLPQVFASYHIWVPGEERMAKLEKLFLHPWWSSSLIEQEFMLGETPSTTVVVIVGERLK